MTEKEPREIHNVQRLRSIVQMANELEITYIPAMYGMYYYSKLLVDVVKHLLIAFELYDKSQRGGDDD